MTENIVLQRAKRAGNMLIAFLFISMVLEMLNFFAADDSIDFTASFIGAIVIGLITVAFSAILIRPLKKDKIKTVRIIYIILGVFSVFSIYFSTQDYSFIEEISIIIEYVLIIIALFSLGKAGKICCFIAAGVVLISMILNATNPDYGYVYYISAILQCVYYIFLGLYVESKGLYEEEIMAQEGVSEELPDDISNDGLNKYDELIKLKELMDQGVITPSEYEAKKKQLLGL